MHMCVIYMYKSVLVYSACVLKWLDHNLIQAPSVPLQPLPPPMAWLPRVSLTGKSPENGGLNGNIMGKS